MNDDKTKAALYDEAFSILMRINELLDKARDSHIRYMEDHPQAKPLTCPIGCPMSGPHIHEYSAEGVIATSMDTNKPSMPITWCTHRGFLGYLCYTFTMDGSDRCSKHKE